jgi:hypothetical protein
MEDMPSRNVMGIVMAAFAVLLLPALLAAGAVIALLLFLFVAVPLCPRVMAAASRSIGGCAQCYTDFCPVMVGLIMFILLPLGLTVFLILRRRSRLP